MRSQLLTWKALGLFACLAIIAAVRPAGAVVIDFEDLGVAVGTQLNPPSGVGVTSRGYNYLPGPNNASGYNDLHIGNQQPFLAFNGTTIGATHDDVIVVRVGGQPFNLISFDFAGSAEVTAELPFTVTGLRRDASVVSAYFTPDGLADGPGGVDDFQTFTLGSSWTNLVRVTWGLTSVGPAQGIFVLDNIVATPVPEPMSMALLGIGILGLFGARRRAA